MHSDITGIILAGGNSLRMGANKALLPLGKKRLIEWTAELLSGLFNKTIIISNIPEDYAFLGLEVIPDLYPSMGPMAGIHSGLVHSATEKNFCISCDIPLITNEMIEYIVETETRMPVVICEEAGFLQSMAGVYCKCLAPLMETQLIDAYRNDERNAEKKNKCSLYAFLKNTDKEVIKVESLPFYSRDQFFNMNTEADYEYVKKVLEKRA